MAWKIEFAPEVQKDLKKVGKSEQKKIFNYIKNRILTLDDPRSLGKPLKGDKSGFWRYRVENHRIICKIEDEKLIILVLAVGHRKNIYKKGY